MTGVRVSPLCLGAMMFGSWGNTGHDDCVEIIHRALDAGINFVDTANVYSAGESEEIVGRALDLPVLAVAWTLVHPAVTSAIIGPRTSGQLEQLLPAAEAEIPTEVLDAIDAIVAPGATLNPADLGYENPNLRPDHRRRTVTRT